MLRQGSARAKGGGGDGRSDVLTVPAARFSHKKQSVTVGPPCGLLHPRVRPHAHMQTVVDRQRTRLGKKGMKVAGGTWAQQD